jgi:uncharacterized protein YkwD
MRGQAQKFNKFSFLAAAIPMLIIFGFYSGTTAAQNPDKEKSRSTQISVNPSFTIVDLLDKTNSAREENNVSRLASEKKLQAAAQKKAEDMAKNNYFAHTAPSGKNPWQWLDEENYIYQKAGENLAVNFENSSELIKGWLDSPSHKKNLLNENFKEVGIGIAQGTFEGRSAVYVVEFYATPEKRLSSDIFNRLLTVL